VLSYLQSASVAAIARVLVYCQNIPRAIEYRMTFICAPGIILSEASIVCVSACLCVQKKEKYTEEKFV